LRMAEPPRKRKQRKAAAAAEARMAGNAVAAARGSDDSSAEENNFEQNLYDVAPSTPKKLSPKLGATAPAAPPSIANTPAAANDAALAAEEAREKRMADFVLAQLMRQLPGLVTGAMQSNRDRPPTPAPGIDAAARDLKGAVDVVMDNKRGGRGDAKVTGVTVNTDSGGVDRLAAARAALPRRGDADSSAVARTRSSPTAPPPPRSSVHMSVGAGGPPDDDDNGSDSDQDDRNNDFGGDDRGAWRHLPDEAKAKARAMQRAESHSARTARERAEAVAEMRGKPDARMHSGAWFSGAAVTMSDGELRGPRMLVQLQSIELDCYRWVKQKSWDKPAHLEQALWVAHMMDLMVKTHGDRVSLSPAWEGMARRIQRLMAVDSHAGGATWANTAHMDLPVCSGPTFDVDLAAEAIAAHGKEAPKRTAGDAAAGGKGAGKSGKGKSGGGGGAAANSNASKKKSTKGKGGKKGKGAGAPPGGAAAGADNQ